MSTAAGIKAGRAYIELGLKENVAREISRVGAKLQGLGRSATLIGGTALGAAAGMGALLLKPLQLAGNLEQTQTKFTTMLGSAEAAVRMLDFLKQKAAATPFELTICRTQRRHCSTSVLMRARSPRHSMPSVTRAVAMQSVLSRWR